MRKWISVSSPPIIIVFLVSFGFKMNFNNQGVPKSLQANKSTNFSFPQNEDSAEHPILLPPFIGNAYIGFKEAMAFKESRGKYGVVNSLGYLGKYQFGKGTLELVGIYNPDYFLVNPQLQERAFKTNIARNKWILRKDIEKYVGLEIGNSHITESGIIAAAHLAGPGNVKKYLRSLGAHDVNDDYGTSISHYIKYFSGYDISMILPKRNAKI